MCSPAWQSHSHRWKQDLESLVDAVTWLAVLHVIHVLLTALVAVSVLLLVDSFRRATAGMTTVGTSLCPVILCAYGTLRGIGPELAMLRARDLPVAQPEGV